MSFRANRSNKIWSCFFEIFLCFFPSAFKALLNSRFPSAIVCVVVRFFRYPLRLFLAFIVVINDSQLGSGLEFLEQEFGLQALQRLYSATTTEINFPVHEFPEKVKSFNLDKQPLVEGVLKGIKGQYLILDTGVINIRKYTAYNVQFSVN